MHFTPFILDDIVKESHVCGSLKQSLQWRNTFSAKPGGSLVCLSPFYRKTPVEQFLDTTCKLVLDLSRRVP